MYKNIKEMIGLAEQQDVPIWRVVLDNETELTGATEEAVFAEMAKRYDVMKKSAERALGGGLPTVGGLITGIASRHGTYAEGGGLTGRFLNRVMARALSCSETNAAMGKICACPTAGACGVVPAVLVSLAERDGLTEDVTLQALLTATGFGAIITKNASVSGAEAGCQAECGVAGAMAAAAAVFIAGGTAAQSAEACSVTLMNCMGLVCDPVAGLVQIPCAYRNANQAVSALLSADLALGGLISPIPADEVVEAMYAVGRALPESLRETASGGVAATEAGRNIMNAIFGA